MSGLKDNYGAEIGMRVTCQRCGTQTFRKQVGYNTVDAAIENRHSFLDNFEPIADGWKLKHDLGGWTCPNCIEQYDAFINKFKNGERKEKNA